MPLTISRIGRWSAMVSSVLRKRLALALAPAIALLGVLVVPAVPVQAAYMAVGGALGIGATAVSARTAVQLHYANGSEADRSCHPGTTGGTGHDHRWPNRVVNGCHTIVYLFLDDAGNGPAYCLDPNQGTGHLSRSYRDYVIGTTKRGCPTMMFSYVTVTGNRFPGYQSCNPGTHGITEQYQLWPYQLQNSCTAVVRLYTNDNETGSQRCVQPGHTANLTLIYKSFRVGVYSRC
jgi:hypothetical protein